MTQRFFALPDGSFYGSIDLPDDAPAPDGLIETGVQPQDYRQTWNGEVWSPPPTFKDAAALLNADYQADIVSLNQAYGTATMAGGASQATKQAAITTQYNTRKTKYQLDYAALRAQYGV